LKSYSFLIFDGIDTIASVYMNGHHLGDTENMYREYVFVVDRLLFGPNSDENELKVIVRSPLAYAKTKANEYPYVVPHSQYPNSEKHWNFLRKAGCHWGWDWVRALLIG
jgi:beta-mannosidase